MGGIMTAVAKPIRKGKEERIASRKKDYLGLCSLCQNGSTCTYTRDLRRPVLQCEDFNGYESRVRTIVKKILPVTDPKFGSNVGEKELGKYKGLCSICEDRKICTYPKPEGGVWHCEEYR
jgi:hypothetical protein